MDNMIKMEHIAAQIKTQERITDGYVLQIREELEKLDGRINDKEKQNGDMLRQVVDIEHRVLLCSKKVNG